MAKEYIAPDGKTYELIGTDINDLPDFKYDDDGNLLFKYNSTPETEYDFQVDEDGYLVTDAVGVTILDDGYIDAFQEWIEVKDAGVSAEIQTWLNATRSHNKMIKLKVTLLNENYAEIESLTGKIIGAPSYDMESDSDIRRTCAITLSVPAKEQIQLDFEKTWNKRMVELACGIYSWENKDYIWFKLGRMLMTSGSTTFDATTQEIKLNLVDLMASMTPERGSQIGTSLKFPGGSTDVFKGTNVRDALIAIVTTFSPFKLYNICEFEDTIPYDIDIDSGEYPIEAIKAIIDLFPYYEYFYDIDGKFTVRMIPTKIEDPIDFSKEFMDDLLISESRDINFSDVYNTTEIWGRELSSDYTALSCITDGDCYKVTIDASFEELVDGESYTIMPTTDSVIGQTMKIQDTTEYLIYTSNGSGTQYTPLVAGEMKADVPYSIRYFEEKFVLQGELSVRCIVMEITEEPSQAVKDSYMSNNACNNVEWVVNPDSPFACTIQNGFIQGEKKQVLKGGEYDAIYTTQLAFERARFENWQKCRLQDTIEIEMILVPWMEINDKIEFTSPSREEVGVWLVKGISYDFSRWTMTVNANRFYPYYPW